MKKAIGGVFISLNAFLGNTGQGSQASAVAKKILQMSEVREKNPQTLENKVDQLSDQFAKHYLFVKKQIETVGPAAATNKDFNCSYCGQNGHRPTQYPQNPHMNTLCTILGGMVHFLEKMLVQVATKWRSLIRGCRDSKGVWIRAQVEEKGRGRARGSRSRV